MSPSLNSVAELRERLRSLGATSEHVSHVLRAWMQVRALDNRRRPADHYLPQRVRAALPALFAELDELLRIVSQHDAADGARRHLLALQDGATIESVLLPMEGRSAGLCVSTQVGCAVACVFCKTGESGLLRQLGGAHIVAQVVLARRQRSVNKVVFMGMGEPAHNLDAVMDAIDGLGREGGIAHKQLVLSTVGDARLFDRLDALALGDVRPALALSLHSSFDERRRQLLPKAPPLSVEELVARADAYARRVGYPIQVQWTLIEGVNDGDDEIAGIVRLLRGRHAMLNMIPLNAVEGGRHRRPDKARCDAIFAALNRQGVLTRMRQSAGQDVDAGCGQLRARALAADGAVPTGVSPIRSPSSRRVRDEPAPASAPATSGRCA